MADYIPLKNLIGLAIAEPRLRIPRVMGQIATTAASITHPGEIEKSMVAPNHIFFENLTLHRQRGYSATYSKFMKIFTNYLYVDSDL
jgi:hypothetical protein